MVLVGDRGDQVQVGLDQLLLGFGIAESDAACEVHLLLCREPSCRADLLEQEFEVLAARIALCGSAVPLRETACIG